MTIKQLARPVRRALIASVLMLGVASASVILIPTAKLADTRKAFDLETSVPKDFGGWHVDTSMVPLPPSPDQQATLNAIYDQILSRTYVNGNGDRVMLSITYGSRQTQQLRAHRQEVCYSAQGFKITGLERLDLRLGQAVVPATRMVATQGSRVEPVTYWFTMGDNVVLSYWDREIQQFKFSMSGYVPDGYLVRVSSLNPDARLAFAQQAEFARQIMSQLDPDLRHRLIGSY